MSVRRDDSWIEKEVSMKIEGALHYERSENESEMESRRELARMVKREEE